jgi:hypothetical protein
MKQINLYYGSPWSRPIYTKAQHKAEQIILSHDEPDRITRVLGSTTKQIKLNYGLSRGRSKYSYITARN